MTRRSVIACALALTACGEGHAPREDSVAVARMVAAQAVPVVTAGVAAELSVRPGPGGAFDSTFRAELRPAVERLRGGTPAPPVVIEMRVSTLRLEGDSAEVVVHRRGSYRADTARFSSSDTRYRLLWQKEGGWTLTQTEPFNFQGEGVPPARARDVWWPPRDTAKP